jgi:hypothetical protein
MKHQTAIPTREQASTLVKGGLPQHTAVHTSAEHERAPDPARETRFNHDFSQAAVRPLAPIVGQRYATSACPAFPRTCPSGGACHVCPPQVQTKLKVNQPGDRYEREADRMAEGVMRMQESPAALASTDPGPAQAPHVNLQRSAASRSIPLTVPPTVHEVLRSPGQPLDPATRGFMERRFGHDFSQVRVHADAKAAASAHAVDALAYTVGPHIAFGSGQYTPGTSEGNRLIAHELTHFVQQASSRDAFFLQPIDIPDDGDAFERQAQAVSTAVAEGRPLDPIQPSPIAPNLQRQPQSSRARRTITQVDVDQTTPQKVTITWNDGGPPESDECSTGKGHCCFDESLAEGGVCSAAGSRVGGTNCTPVGTFKVTKKIPKTASGVELWTQFVDSRSIALHDYDPLVDGTPLSHGCVRLHQPMAQKIFDGAVVGKTRVRVRNLAQPRCNHPMLQAEWMRDFDTAGTTPPDGERVDPVTGQRRTREELARRSRQRRSIARERRDLRSALGISDDELDDVIAALRQPTSNFSNIITPAAREALLAHIPRCLPTQTTEEARIPAAIQAGVATPTPLLGRLRYMLARTGSLRAARRVVRQLGQQLWDDATGRAQGSSPDTDDRTLYWARLQMTQAIRQAEPGWLRRLNPDRSRRARQELLDAFERASRGMESAEFQRDADVKRILISGFDPFGFAGGGDIRQGNPSGAAVLALDGTVLQARGVRGQVQGVIFPVRFTDFESGIAERFFGPQLSGSHPPDLIMTISMGISADFELEMFAGRRRSTTFPGNAAIRGGGTATSPRVIPGVGPGPEFLRTNVPPTTLEAMRRALGRQRALPGETTVREIPPGSTGVRESATGPTPGSMAVAGSGGGFLSNEIYYRTGLLGQRGASVPVIHLHTPQLTAAASSAQRAAIIATIRRLLEATLPNL